MPDMAGYIMSFCTSHFFVDSLNRAVLEENRSTKTVSKTFLFHFIRNVNCLAWPDPRLFVRVVKVWNQRTPVLSIDEVGFLFSHFRM